MQQQQQQQHVDLLSLSLETAQYAAVCIQRVDEEL